MTQEVLTLTSRYQWKMALERPIPDFIPCEDEARKTGYNPQFDENADSFLHDLMDEYRPRFLSVAKKKGFSDITGYAACYRNIDRKSDTVTVWLEMDKVKHS